MMLRTIIAIGFLAAASATASAFPKIAIHNAARIPEIAPIQAPGLAFVAIDDRLPRTKLRPAIYDPNLCVYRYRVGTQSADCQKFVDQALGYFYSYVYNAAARCAETALTYDPNCAYAWLVLNKSLEQWGQGDATAALKKAQELLPKAPHREQMLITARLYEKGLLGPKGTEERRKRAKQTLDDMLSIYDDDEEAWFTRGAICGGYHGGTVEGVPYYKALLKINPLHPGANHELVHFYEGSQRPALGWPYAVGYLTSSPGIPHALHMQAHLAMRIGKWDKTTDRSSRAVELEREYQRVQGITPAQDYQYSHHLETLTLSLIHDGRFPEAQAIRKIAEPLGYRYTQSWFRVAVGQHDWKAAEAIVAEMRKGDKPQASYFAAILDLERGDTARASAELDVLRQAQQTRRNDRRLEQRLWEIQGRVQCASGSGSDGLKLLQRIVDRTKNDYNHHAWGGGAYDMENWGIGALDAGNAAAAEEAFLESLAHDTGSAKAALGMEALCGRLGRAEESRRFAALAARLWCKADPKDYTALRSDMARHAEHVAIASTVAGGRSR